jgi:hypothetical protein
MSERDLLLSILPDLWKGISAQAKVWHRSAVAAHRCINKAFISERPNIRTQAQYVSKVSYVAHQIQRDAQTVVQSIRVVMSGIKDEGMITAPLREGWLSISIEVGAIIQYLIDLPTKEHPMIHVSAKNAVTIAGKLVEATQTFSTDASGMKKISILLIQSLMRVNLDLEKVQALIVQLKDATQKCASNVAAIRRMYTTDIKPLLNKV